MKISPHDYDRSERRNASWWGTRHPERRDVGSTLRRSRRITLIDLLLLVVMSAILLPWLLSLDETAALGPYRARLDRKHRDDHLVLVLEVSLPDESPVPAGDLVGWRIFDSGGELLHEEMDLAPEAGQSVEFVKILPDGQAKNMEILAGDHRLRIELDEGR